MFRLDIFGPAAAALSAVLPFGYTTQFCVNIVSGRLGVFVLPVVDLDVRDIPLEEGIAWFYEKAGVGAP